MTINEFKDLLRKVINVPGAIAEMDTIGAFIPDGLICIWSGSEVPNGWLLCDGTNGTPDLADKFVLGGAIADIGTTAAQQDTAISNHSNHVFTQPDTHTWTAADTGTPSLAESVTDDAASQVGVPESNHTHEFTPASKSHTGGAVDAHSAHTVSTQYFPPYYTLAYIMKGVAA